MSKIIVNNQDINYPDPGTEPGWGEPASDFATQVAEVLANLAGPGVINETQATIENTASNKALAGFVFNEAFTQDAIMNYRIFRRTDDVQYSETGTIYISYKPDIPEKWLLTRVINSDVSLVFMDIDSNGQVRATATPIVGDSYEGFIRFKTVSNLK